MGLIEKLENIKTIKSNIKDAIIEKGGVLEDTTPFENYAGEIRNIQTGEDFTINNVEGLFAYGRRNNSVNSLLKHVDWNQVKSLYQMFYSWSSLTGFDAGISFNTSKVTKMSAVFSLCSGLTNVNISCFDTSNVTDMSSMFYGCSKLTSLDLSNFNTVKVTNMNSMFNGCSRLANLDISSFNTAMVTNMNSMFNGCSKLKEIHINITRSTNMTNIFNNCSGLTSLDFTGTTDVLADFDVSKTGLDRTGLMNMISTLPIIRHSQTITIGSTKKSLLSDEDIALFTEKGYTLA